VANQIKQNFVQAGGFKTKYIEAGDPGAPKLVLIHDGGFGTDAELCWGNLIEQLQDEYHIIAPDLLGWGGSDKAVFLDRSPYAGRLPHIAAFLAEVGVKEADFVGASFGGSMVVRASLVPGNPWGIKRAVSISGTGGPFRLQIDSMVDYHPSLEAARNLTALVTSEDFDAEEHVRQRHENSLIPGHWESLNAPRLQNPAATRTPPVDNYFEQLAETTIDTLFVAGAKDPTLEPGWSQKLAELSPRVRDLVIDAGHEPNIDKPAEAARIVREFLNTGKVG
jgi:pimeloyl-ACP methyl ester carboxylesterase